MNPYIYRVTNKKKENNRRNLTNATMLLQKKI